MLTDVYPGPTDVSDALPLRSKNPRRGTAARVASSWPFVAALGLLFVLVAVFFGKVVALNGGQWVYPIDDTYGHMAVAKNLVRHGTWTYSAPNGFDSGDSSLLWPWLIAATYVFFGVNEYSTLVLNLLSAGALVVYTGVMLRRHTRSSWIILGVLSAVVILTPLPLLAMIGMEHCFHAFVCLVFLDLACRWLAQGFPPAPRPTMRWLLPTAAFLLTAVRYEGMFAVGVACLLLLCRREWSLAAIVGCAAAAPVVVFGLFSLSRGWAFLPCSVLLKGNLPTSLEPTALVAFAWRGYDQMLANPHMLFLVVAITVLLLVRFARHATVWSYPTLLLMTVLIVTLVHLQFASLGWFYRYEGYLMAAGIVAVSLALVDCFPTPGNVYWRRPSAWPHLATLLLAGLWFVAPAWQRARESLGLVAQACHNIYEQQFQMAKFVRRYYQGAGVAANDIGCIAYYADVRLCDLAGLVNMDVMRAKRAGTYDQQTVRRLLAKYDVQVVVVYDYWAGEYGGQLPEWGVPIGQWTIPGNIVCAYEKISFYAPRPELASTLTKHLREFASSLPADVTQEGVYRGTRPPHVLGVYYPASDDAGIFHWTSRVANFYLYPENGWPEPPAGSALAVSVKPLTPGQTLDVLVNGERVRQKTFTPAEAGQTWVPLTIQAPWKEGLNVLSFEGHGQTVMPPGDNRRILFGVREPRWTLLPPSEMAAGE